MEKLLFDSHCHISDEDFDDCKEELIKELEESELKLCVDVGSSVETSKRSIESALKYDFCYATVGVHPHCVGELDEDTLLACLLDYEKYDKVVAIGEIGLDYHYDDRASDDVQKYWFGKQVDWAIEHNAPICIHSRDADEETMKLLKEHGAFSKKRTDAFPKKPDGTPDARVLIHCFSGSAELGRQYVKLGAILSLGGPVTFKNARKAVEVAEAIDIQNLLIETDSPYMAPVPLRGTTNKPCNVKYVADKIAEIKGMTYKEVADITFENACRFYGIEIKG